MFDIGWSELLVLGVIALIVVGPKELPGMLRTLGQFANKARGMAREFQRSMEDAAREADLSELRDVQKGMSDFNRKIGMNSPRKFAGSLLEDKPKSDKPAKGSLEEADAVENARWEAEQKAKAASGAGEAVPTKPAPTAAQEPAAPMAAPVSKPRATSSPAPSGAPAPHDADAQAAPSSKSA